VNCLCALLCLQINQEVKTRVRGLKAANPVPLGVQVDRCEQMVFIDLIHRISEAHSVFWASNEGRCGKINKVGSY